MLSVLDESKNRSEFFRILKSCFPNAAIELDHCDYFTLLMSAVLSAQCTDKVINKCLSKLFADGDCPEDLF